MPRLVAAILCAGLGLVPQIASAQETTTPLVDRVRAFLIYEDTGDLSKNLAKTEDQIIANDEKGTSIQMLLDVVLTSKPDQPFENNPMLHVVARSNLDQAVLTDKTFPLNYVGSKGELVRTVVVDHGCNGFDLDAYVMDGKNKTSEFKKSFSITCGD